MGEDKFELQGDYTESEKAKQAKKEKKSIAAKKASETRKRKKEQKQKEEDAVFWKQQTEKGYKNLFGENNNVKNIKNMANTIRISEENLRNIISEAVTKVIAEEYNISEEELQEGWLGQIGDAGKTFFSKDNAGKGLNGRFDAARKNYATRGELDNLQGLKDQLIQLVNAKQIDPNSTVAQLIGGNMNGGKFGRLSGAINNRKGQMMRRGLK